MSDEKKMQLTRKQLEQIQARNLKFLETWSETCFQPVRGVPVVKACAYELIQMFNIRSEEELLK